MPLFLDIHHVEGATEAAVADAHARDLSIQEQYGVRYKKYWFDASSGTIFCLVESPDKEAAEMVHRDAHGLVASEIYEVSEYS